MRYAIEALLIASAALAGYLYASQPTHCESIVFAELKHAQVLSGELAKYSGNQDFLTTLTQGRK